MTLKSLREFIVRCLVGNLVTKLMALAIALALWAFAYTFSYVPSVRYSVPVRVPGREGWSVSVETEGNNDRQTVDVEFLYPRRFQSQVDQLFRTGGAVYAQVGPGEALDETGSDIQDIKKVPLTEQDLVVNRALGIKVIRFDPAKINLHYVRETSKSVIVHPRLSDPPSDYQATTPYCTPRAVTVRGPKNIISSATEIDTEVIDISAPVPMPNLQDWSLTVRARLTPYVTVAGQRYPVTVSEDTVECLITLTRVPAERVFENVPIQLLAPPNYPYVASLRDGESATSVRVSGPASVIKSLNAENIVLFVNVGSLKPSEVYDTAAIEADIVGVPNADRLSVTLGSPDRAVKVTEPNPK